MRGIEGKLTEEGKLKATSVGTEEEEAATVMVEKGKRARV
jgi:hypothetical protein